MRLKSNEILNKLNWSCPIQYENKCSDFLRTQVSINRRLVCVNRATIIVDSQIVDTKLA